MIKKTSLSPRYFYNRLDFLCTQWARSGGGGGCNCNWKILNQFPLVYGVSRKDKNFAQLLRGDKHQPEKTKNGTFRVPTRTGKPGKMGRHFPVREKSGNFEQTGKVREKSGKITQNTGKLRKIEINII